MYLNVLTNYFRFTYIIYKLKQLPLLEIYTDMSHILLKYKIIFNNKFYNTAVIQEIIQNMT